jgi:hypothetical protein
MGLNVLIPVASGYTLYARGEVESHVTVEGRGTYIEFTEGSLVILFYKWKRRHRRVYLVRDIAYLRHYEAVKLPGVREAVGILGKFRGRRVDILRRAYFNLERINTFGVYRYTIRFWQRVVCLIDDYHGRHTGAVISNLMELSRRYAMTNSPLPEGPNEQGA